MTNKLSLTNSGGSNASSSTTRTVTKRSSLSWGLEGMFVGIVLGGLLLVGVQVYCILPHASQATSQAASMSMESFVQRPKRNSFASPVNETAAQVLSSRPDIRNDGIMDRDTSASLKRLIESRTRKHAAGHDATVDRFLAHADPDLEPILRILHHGGFDVTNKTIFDEDTMALLPKWSTIMDAYGPPKILGLETCEDYRKQVPVKRRNTGAAGTFNSGTNLVATLIYLNCHLEKGRFRLVYSQVPWGKHFPASSRYNHTYARKSAIYPPPTDTAFPVVTIRDPYTWMQSMCRQPYAASFDHDTQHCPNLVPSPEDIKTHPRYAELKYMPVTVRYSNDYQIDYDSLAHLWNEWYRQYVFEYTYPKLIVRMEDLIFHADTIVPQICECIGAEYSGTLRHVQEARNRNVGIDLNQTGLLTSIIKYGNIANRRKGYERNQLEAARTILGKGSLMEIFGYPYEKDSNIGY